MNARKPHPHETALMDDLKAALAKHDVLTGLQMLQITCVLVGQLIALQDQTQYTTDQIMAVVGRNIEAGNAQAIHNLLGNPKGQA